MPRSVVLLSSDPDLFKKVRGILGSDPRFIVAGDTVHCDGSVSPLTNIYPVAMALAEWTNWDPAAAGVPDPGSSSHVIFESQSPEWVAEVGRLLAQRLTTPVWIVDSADTAWPADQVDPTKVVLA